MCDKLRNGIVRQLKPYVLINETKKLSFGASNCQFAWKQVLNFDVWMFIHSSQGQFLVKFPFKIENNKSKLFSFNLRVFSFFFFTADSYTLPFLQVCHIEIVLQWRDRVRRWYVKGGSGHVGGGNTCAGNKDIEESKFSDAYGDEEG